MLDLLILIALAAIAAAVALVGFLALLQGHVRPAGVVDRAAPNPTLLERLVRRTLWRFPALATTFWLWPWAGARVQLIVELPQATAAGLDLPAVLGLGHDRQRLVLRYRLQCGHVYRPDCQFCARLDALGEGGVAGLVAQAVRNRWRVYAPRMQEDLFDANGYAPGVYEIDVQSERAVLAALDAREDAQPVPAKAPRHDSSADRGARGDQRCAQRGVSNPAHSTPYETPTAQHSAKAGA